MQLELWQADTSNWDRDNRLELGQPQADHDRDRLSGEILIGARFDGRPHDPRSIAELQEVATLVAAAVGERRDL